MLGMVTNNNNQVNLEQVCSLNIEQSRLLQFGRKRSQRLSPVVGPQHPVEHSLVFWIQKKTSFTILDFP